MKGGSTKLVRDIVREYAGNLGSQEAAEEEGGDRRRAETEHLLSLVDKFWVMLLWLELQTKVIRRFPKISQSQRRPLLGPACPLWLLRRCPNFPFLRDCEIFGNLRIAFVSSSIRQEMFNGEYSRNNLIYLVRSRALGGGTNDGKTVLNISVRMLVCHQRKSDETQPGGWRKYAICSENIVTSRYHTQGNLKEGKVNANTKLEIKCCSVFVCENMCKL